MKDYNNIRVLLQINLRDRQYYYSDIDGVAHKYTTSTDGRVVVEDDMQQYEGLITNAGQISREFDKGGGSSSIGNIKITLFNKDNLHLSTAGRAIESGTATLFFVRGDFYDDVIGTITGKIDDVSYDSTTISFSIKGEEHTVFRNVPEVIMEEDSFQKTLILKGAKTKAIALALRFGNSTATTALFGRGFTADAYANVVRQLVHPALESDNDDYWVGSRVDVVDATGDGGNPESSLFCIGEFGVVVNSGYYDAVKPYGYGVRFNTTVDRYLLYNSVDHTMRISGGESTTDPFEMRSVVNNTLTNCAAGSLVGLLNEDFVDDVDWNKGSGWTISGWSVYGSSISDVLTQEISLTSGVTYNASINITSASAGTVKFYLGSGVTAGTYSPLFSAAGFYETKLTHDGSDDLFTIEGAGFTGRISRVKITTDFDVTFMLKKRPLPENSDSVGRPFPIAYGKIEKLPAIQAISTKSTRQNSISAGDDFYGIASHRILDKDPTEVLVWFGLEENVKEQEFLPGTIDYVPVPLPRSIAEVDKFKESDYELRSGDPDKDVSPFHKLVELTTNKGELITGIKLRGDEYNWLVTNDGSDNADGDLPAINGQPQFPIRYGLGNSKVYVSFRGYEDVVGNITGNSGTLIEHPVDIIKHFMLNYTNLNGDFSKLDIESFEIAKAKLQDWRFSLAINDVVNGREVIDRICRQSMLNWNFVDGKMKLYVFDLINSDPTIFLDYKKHFSSNISFSRPGTKDLANDFILNYGYSHVTEKYDRIVKRNKKNDRLCRNFYGNYGIVISLDPVELPDIRDSFTANAYADRLVQQYATTRLQISTDLYFTEETANLNPGDIVQITYIDPSGSEMTSTFYTLSVKVGKNGISADFMQSGKF